MAVSVKTGDRAHEKAVAVTTLAERIESIKAGVVGAGTVGLVFAGLTAIRVWLLSPLTPLPTPANPLNLAFSVGIAILSGFLFGITYRYVIRQDNNPHLESGAVLAFGLVRGLAQVDGGLNHWQTLLPFVEVTVESIVLFAIARFALNKAFKNNWVQPFLR